MQNQISTIIYGSPLGTPLLAFVPIVGVFGALYAQNVALKANYARLGDLGFAKKLCG